jgi:hypothetical protein
MLKTVTKMLTFAVLFISTMTFSTNSYASSSQGLNAKLAQEVRLSLWMDGANSNYKDAYSYYLDLLEADQMQEQTQQSAQKIMPAELLIPLANL